MSKHKHAVQFVVVAMLVGSSLIAVCQKVKVGYDKSIDFSRYKTYKKTDAGVPITRPLLYETIIGSIDHQLKGKRFTEAADNPDLVLICEGGMNYGLNQGAAAPVLPTYSGPPPTFDSTVWTGAPNNFNLMAPAVPDGSLNLTFVDPRQNRIVWSGTVTQKLDFENKKDSLKRAEKAVQALLRDFPPKKK